MYFRHLLDIELLKTNSKKTLAIALLFVITAVIGIGGGLQQVLINITNIQPKFDLRNESLKVIIVTLIIHSIPFIIGVLSIFFTTKFILNRKIKSLFGSTNKLLYKILVGMFLCSMGVFTSFAIKFWDSDQLYLTEMNTTFLFTTTLLFVFIFVQVLFEELLFRALLPQTLVGFGLSRIMSIVLASIIFGILHSNNPEVSFYGPSFLIVYVIHGLFLGFIYYFENSIWLGLIFHFFNNFFVLFIINNEEQILKYPSLVFSLETVHLTAMDIIISSIIMMTFYFVFSYHIFEWKNKLKSYR